MGNVMEASLGAPVKWALSLNMYVKSLRGRLNTMFVSLRFILLRNDPIYVNQVIIWEYSDWQNCGDIKNILMKQLHKVPSRRRDCAHSLV